MGKREVGVGRDDVNANAVNAVCFPQAFGKIKNKGKE